MEGQLGNLIIEAARLVDAVAKAVESKAGYDPDGDKIDYDIAMAAILSYVAQVSKIDTEGNIWSYEDEIKFMQQARDLRMKHQHDDDFLDYDSGSSIPQKKKDAKGAAKAKANSEITETLNHKGTINSTSEITGGASLDGFVLDTRLSEDDIMDIEDLRKFKKGKGSGRKK